VVSVALIKDRDTGRSKGFGFVEMNTQKEAEAARASLNGRLVGERALKVDIARPREEQRSSYNSGYNRRDSGRRGRRN
jgi:RNA recognition motif-containing protein